MRPFALLVALFFAIPLVEIYTLIKVGSVIGALLTIVLVVFTAMLGALLLRWQGLSTLMRFRDGMNRGELPAFELLEGVMLLVGGALLLTPGFFTDLLGFLCLVPASRRAIVKWLMKRATIRVNERRSEQASSHRTLEGHFRRVPDE